MGGVPFSVGNKNFEMEGGEYVLNKKAVQQLGVPFLDKLNSINYANSSAASQPNTQNNTMDIVSAINKIARNQSISIVVEVDGGQLDARVKRVTDNVLSEKSSRLGIPAMRLAI
jgi:hypothetical protein